MWIPAYLRVHPFKQNTRDLVSDGKQEQLGGEQQRLLSVCLSVLSLCCCLSVFPFSVCMFVCLVPLSVCLYHLLSFCLSVSYIPLQLESKLPSIPVTATYSYGDTDDEAPSWRDSRILKRSAKSSLSTADDTTLEQSRYLGKVHPAGLECIIDECSTQQAGQVQGQLNFPLPSSLTPP